MRELLSRIACPVLVIHGTGDAVRPWESGARLAELANGELALSRGRVISHTPATRSRSTCCYGLRRPAAAVRALGARQVAPQARALRVLADRPRPRAARRGDRRRAPKLLPTSRSTGSRSTRSPRCSRRAASTCIRRAVPRERSAHIESESAEHDLHVFQAIRSMDEIMVANFMLFQDIVEERLRRRDRRRGLGARPLLARTPGAQARGLRWFTDFVGYMPMPEGGERERS